MIQKVFMAITALIFCCTAFYLLYNFGLKQENTVQKNELAELFSQEKADKLAEQISSESEGDVNAGLPEKKLASIFESLKRINKDVMGMLIIPGTDVTYPVVQRDNSYYLSHNIYGESDIYGSIFLDENCDLQGKNFIIYGHAMRDGAMFGGLKKYQEPEYLKKHDTVYLYTEYGKFTYKPMALIFSQGRKNINDLYQTFPFSGNSKDDVQQYQAFWEIVAQETGESISDANIEKDAVLMLITCSYHEEDGRMMLIAERQEK